MRFIIAWRILVLQLGVLLHVVLETLPSFGNFFSFKSILSPLLLYFALKGLNFLLLGEEICVLPEGVLVLSPQRVEGLRHVMAREIG